MSLVSNASGQIAADFGQLVAEEYFNGTSPPRWANLKSASKSILSGLETTSDGNDGRWVQSGNWVRHVLSRPMVGVPGERMINS